MEFRTLEFGLNAVASQGVTLNMYEKVSLDVALVKLKKKASVERELFFWGKLCCQETDYYISYVVGDEQPSYPTKKFYYSTGEFDFRDLPILTDEQKKQLDAVGNIVLIGVPNRVIELGNEEGSSHHRVALNEVHALSHRVSRIDDSTAVVPRGAFRLKFGNKIAPAPEFKGLSFGEAQKISSWVHFRPAENLENLKALASTDYQFHADFLETLESDVPKGSWSVRYDPSSSTVTVRSLLWPGYIAYCVLNTNFFGGVYIGNGEQNLDLPFLLP
ncbi:putative Radial spoke head protein 9 [Toxoplasma gondii GAB2-2007-GAL-DOM2]|uniref:Radial spoke head protein 9 homolog n=6 Tax=Toxoplasma gondii TaxID=5811 RepID=S7V1Z9_TOXGG|nr:putative Radial spoke head protein 9 [Toxoplasma gondii GT1]KAF4641564.1 putative Radial spoke head protein 9 [Toxoplasma gondii]KFG30056.1 putative Radial spoke head protein 9 [Toxoplasma gondii GAB2-2007-GAL-DOM2]KFG36956.1 putative Radial spoke head protein 9 [Toxoplasma gondii FOU]PUA85759.1 putative Radial spoke head protein 9 [Toxoplasma gondii TgCATBr9]RQX68188.1 putative Radial spoke head protein 9 [Toxoplasma gondii CAST]